MLATTVNLPTRRAPSPQIRARDTSLDGTTNSSAGINSAPNVDAGINGATHLGGQRCGDHEDRGDYRVSFRDGNKMTAHYTDNLEDAVNTVIEKARKRGQSPC